MEVDEVLDVLLGQQSLAVERVGSLAAEHVGIEADVDGAVLHLLQEPGQVRSQRLEGVIGGGGKFRHSEC